MPLTEPASADAAEIFRELLGSRCLLDSERLRPYEVPERGAPGRARCVLLPESEAEVGGILELANTQGFKLVISAGRTGLVEAQRPEGEGVLSLERLKRVLAIDPERRLATVEAGVSIDALNAELEPLGLMFPLEMGSSASATLGAAVANGSAGANAVCYGTAAQMCEAAWGFWGNGEAAGPCAAASRGMKDANLLAINSAVFDPDWGLVGSQGALGVITRVQLRLQPIPAQREGALLAVESLPAAMDVLAAAHAEFGADVEEFEFLSQSAIELVRALKGPAFRWPFDGNGRAAYYVLLQVKSRHADDDLVSRLYELFSKELCLPENRVGYAPLPALKALRHSVTEASNARMRSRSGGRLAFDTATPPARFGDYLARLEAQIEQRWPELEFVAFGHAGVGGAHLHVLGSREHPVENVAVELTKLVLDITADFGGTFSAEHGVGTKWAEEFIRRTGPALLERMLAAKRAHDPRNLLNPRCFGFDRLLNN